MMGVGIYFRDYTEMILSPQYNFFSFSHHKYFSFIILHNISLI